METHTIVTVTNPVLLCPFENVVTEGEIVQIEKFLLMQQYFQF